MSDVTLKNQEPTLELSLDELDRVAGGMRFYVPKFRADIREGERFASGYVPPLWGEVC
jgi:hypothetical protein